MLARGCRVGLTFKCASVQRRVQLAWVRLLAELFYQNSNDYLLESAVRGSDWRRGTAAIGLTVLTSNTSRNMFKIFLSVFVPRRLVVAHYRSSCNSMAPAFRVNLVGCLRRAALAWFLHSCTVKRYSDKWTTATLHCLTNSSPAWLPVLFGWLLQ